MNSDKKPFHETVAEKLIEQLREGTAPWQKPWMPGEAGTCLPFNPTTGKRYKGINALHLMSEGREDQRWMTYKQAMALDAQVRKGEQGTQIQYWKFGEEQVRTDANGKRMVDERGEPIREMVRLERPRVFFATVFNADQIDGLPARVPRVAQAWSAVERADRILQASGAAIHSGEHDRAFYRPATDSIHLPDKSQFRTADSFYATALHELGHWTGHPTRLGRDLVHPFGSEGYAREELRAEIASMILGDELGIGHDPGQHAAYVGSWIKALQDDPLEIFRAAAEAEKIRDYVLGFEQKQVQEQATETPFREQTMEAEMEVLRTNESAPLGTRSAEAWLISRVQNGGIFRAIDHAKPTQMDRIDQLLKSMIPLDKQNPFWQRNELPSESDDLPAKIEQARDLLAARKVDSPVVAARLALHEKQRSAPDATAFDEFHAAARSSLGIQLPREWSGRVLVRSNAASEIEGKTEDASLPLEGRPAQSWGVYAEGGDSLYAWLAEYSTEQLAEDLAERLKWIDASSTVNEYEKAAKLARLNEERIRRDPACTDEDISLAKELRKDAEFAATANEEDLQRRIEIEKEKVSRADTVKAKGSTDGDSPPKSRNLIDVPYAEKDAAKALGARWDRREQSWYVPDGVDAAAFAKWTSPAKSIASDQGQLRPAKSGEESVSRPAFDRTYLAVPYAERAAARIAGAEWDAAVKSWYAGAGADATALARWSLEDVSPTQGPAMSPREEFADDLKLLGCVISGEHPVMDGKTHRISVEGEKFSKNSGSGFYVGHLDGHPAGFIKNNKTGVEMKWKSKGYVLGSAQKAHLAAEAASKLQARQVELEKQQEQAAARVAKQLEKLVPVTAPTPYMQAKGIDSHTGAYTDQEGRKTYLPAVDAEGKQWSMQYIGDDGTKRFARESRKDGCFHVVGGIDSLPSVPVLVIAEGYATAAQLKQTLGYATVAAFDSGNLVAVALALRQKFPGKPVLIAGDDDRHLELTQGVNPGRIKAEEAAKLVGGAVIMPVFAPGESSLGADLAAVTPVLYRQHRRSGNTLSEKQVDSLERMKQFTDFNDMATRSMLGIEGVARQLRSSVEAVAENNEPSLSIQHEARDLQIPENEVTQSRKVNRHATPSFG